MTIARAILLTLLLSAVAGAVGAWGGARYVQARTAARPGALHETLHRKLRLSPAQQQRLAGLEQAHAARRRALEAEMRAANAQLAQAYQQSHAYTPQAQAAIDRFHRAMAALQTETLQHVIAMRAVLQPGQTPAFDETVVRSLTAAGS